MKGALLFGVLRVHCRDIKEAIVRALRRMSYFTPSVQEHVLLPPPPPSALGTL